VFSSLLAYQLVDLMIAAAAIAAVVRGFPKRWHERLQRRFPLALATPFRRLALVEFPAFLALAFAAIVAGQLVVFPLLDRSARGHPSIQYAANVGTFVLLGATYLGSLIVFPLAGAWRAWRESAPDAYGVARRRSDRRLAVVGVALAFGLGVYASVIEPNRLVVEEVDVALPGWPAGRPPLRVVLLADLQSARLGARERRVPEIVASLHPDVVLIAGDLVAQSFDESLPIEQAHHVLSRLKAPLGVFVVNGDVDELIEGGVRRAVDGMPVRLLDNESVVLDCDPPVELCGADPHDRGAMARMLAAPPRARLRVGLVHRPRHYAELGAAGCELVLAGHTHGGQVVIPGFGPPMTYEILPRRVCAGGLHRMSDGTQLYVTRGIGLEGGFAPPVRFLCPPEITLLRIGAGADAAEAIGSR